MSSPTADQPDLSQVEVDWPTILQGVQDVHSRNVEQLAVRVASSEAVARKLQVDLQGAREALAASTARAEAAEEDVQQLRSMVLGAEAHAQTLVDRIAELESTPDEPDADQPAADRPKTRGTAAQDTPTG